MSFKSEHFAPNLAIHALFGCSNHNNFGYSVQLPDFLHFPDCLGAFLEEGTYTNVYLSDKTRKIFTVECMNMDNLFVNAE